MVPKRVTRRATASASPTRRLATAPTKWCSCPSWVSNLDNHWEQPAVENFYRRLALLSRLILFASRTSTPVKRLRGRAST